MVPAKNQELRGSGPLALGLARAMWTCGAPILVESGRLWEAAPPIPTRGACPRRMNNDQIATLLSD